MARRNNIQSSMLMEDELDSMFLDEVTGENGFDSVDDEFGNVTQQPQEIEEVVEEAEENDDAQLAVDIYESPTELIIKARVAGVDRHDLDVAVLNGVVTIQGSLMSTDTEDIQQYHLQECYWGRFYRQITLPVAINETEEALEDCASLRDGVLTIRLIKEKTEAARKIKIN